LTNKVKEVSDTNQSLQQDFTLIHEQLENLAQIFGKTYQNFEGGQLLDSDGVRHKFSNPRENKITNWLFYGIKTANSNGIMLTKK
jgi:hypothetical protein